MPSKAGREPAGCVVVIASELGRKIGIVGLADVLPEKIKSDLATRVRQSPHSRSVISLA